MSNYIYYGNALVCFLSAMRIYSFNRGKSEFKRGYGVLAIVLASAFMWVALRTLSGTYNSGSVDISEFVLNSFLCVALIVVKGNVAAFFRYERPIKEGLHHHETNRSL